MRDRHDRHGAGGRMGEQENTRPLQEEMIPADSPNGKPRLFRYCCEELVDALRYGIMELDGNYGEINLGYHPLDERWQVGNILTGEKYDKKTMTMSMALAYCPFCGTDIGQHEPDEE